MPLKYKYKNAGQSLSTRSRVHRLQSQSTDPNTALNSLQTSTGTRISLHKTAIIVEHRTGPGNTLSNARLRILHVVGVARRGTLTHYAEAVGHPYTCWRHKTTAIHSLRGLCKTTTRVQRLHNTPHRTSYQGKSYHK